MELEAAHKKVLEYLQKYSPVNTFRLSRHLGIKRNELINMLKDLTNKRLVKVKHGSVSINEEGHPKIADNIEEKPVDIVKKAKTKKRYGKTKKRRVSKDNKNQRFLRSFRNQRFQKEKQNELDSWILQRRLDIEKLKIEIKLLSLSPNQEDVSKIRDSIAKLKDAINQKIIEIR